MTQEITTGDDMIDTRDVIARVEELRERHDRDDTEQEELRSLASLLEDLKGNGGDHEWEGDWYPVTLIRDSFFEEAMDEDMEEFGYIPQKIPPFLKIVVDYDMLRMDYSSTEFDGVTYWYR